MRDRSHSLRYRLVFLIGILLPLLLVVLFTTTFAQSNEGGWSTPVKLYEGQGSVREPALAADQTGGLHAFWTYEEEGFPMAIFYARWEDGVWTGPVDVISMPGVIQGPSAVVDQFGRIHLIWQGPGNSLFYSSADVTDAANAAAWTSPVSLAKSNPHAHIVIDDAGTLHVVYPGLVEDGVSYMNSADGGQTWTSPAVVATPARLNATTDFTRLAVAPNGDLHVVWTELTLPSGWPPLGVYYARSTDGGLTWAEPFEMASDGYLEANIVAVGEDVVHVVWNATVSISGRYHKWSADNGVTWSETVEIASRDLSGGSTGPPGLAVDGSGSVHVVVNTADTVPRTGVGEFGATMYSAWNGSDWLPLLNISSPAPNYVSINNEESAIAAVQGNQLHVLFFGDETHTLWHTHKIAPASLVASVPFKPSLSDSMVVERASPIPLPTIIEPIASAPTAVAPDANEISSPAPVSTNPATALIIGILPAVLVVSGAVLFSLNRRRAR